MQDHLNLQYWIERVALFDDEQAFEKIFFLFNDDLYRLAYSFTGSKESSEEIISDTFVNIWKNRTRLVEIENIRLYLYVAVKNLSIKFVSRNKSAGLINLDEYLLTNASGSSATPEDLLVSKEVLRLIENAIEELPPRCRLIFRLVRENGLKYKEVALLLNISVKTIDAQMAIAARRIAQSVSFKIPK